HERDRLRLAGLVVAELLEQRAAYALRYAAAQLSFDQRRVDRPAHLVGDEVAQHPDLPGTRIDVRHRDVDPVGVGHVRHVETAARGQSGRLPGAQVPAGRSRGPG